jgi:AcrR family transcriptional regulator
MNKRRLQKEATRERIIKTAFSTYSRRGFTAPTNMIAQKAGLAHGSIFAHFPTREDLQLAVLERFAQGFGNKMHKLSISNCSITELLYAHIGILEKYESFYKKVISEIPSLPDESKTLVISVQSIMSHHFGAVIKEEQKNGTIKDIPLHMLFNTWIGLVHYYLQNSELFAPGSSVLKRCKNKLVTSFVNLISR